MRNPDESELLLPEGWEVAPPQEEEDEGLGIVEYFAQMDTHEEK